jgi:hypothetical protein
LFSALIPAIAAKAGLTMIDASEITDEVRRKPRLKLSYKLAGEPL